MEGVDGEFWSGAGLFDGALVWGDWLLLVFAGGGDWLVDAGAAEEFAFAPDVPVD